MAITRLWLIPGWCPYLDEATGGDEGGTGTGAAPGAENQAPGAGGEGGEAQTTQSIAAGMLAEIEREVGPQSGDEGGAPGATEGGAQAAPGAQPQAKAGAAQPGAATQPDGQPAAGATTPGEEKKGPKKPTDFELNSHELAAMTPKSRGRHQELISAWKEAEEGWKTEKEQITSQLTGLTRARDDIMSTLTGYQIEPDDFVQLGEFNLLVKTGRFDDAIKVAEGYLAQLYQAVGRDPPGVDPLAAKEHADLKARVDNYELSREDALQLVKARRVQAASEQAQTHQRQTQDTQSRSRAEMDRAMDEVKQWNVAISKDLDYEAKASIILPKLEAVMKKYPPNLWVPTLQLMYEQAVPAPAAQGQQQQQQQPKPQPLRPSGAKGGNAQPGSMLEALENGIPHSY